MLKTESMMSHHPPTPPTRSPQLQYPIHMAHHNVNNTYQYDNIEGAYPSNNAHAASFGGNMPLVHDITSQQPATAHYMPHYDGNTYGDQNAADMGLGISFEGYGASEQDYYTAGSSFAQQNAPGSSPPTPKSTENNDMGRRNTRSGRSVGQLSSPAGKARQAKTPKMRKPKAKADKLKTPKLTAPLSVLTKDYTHIPVKDMEAWVNRSVDVRQKEVEKRHGYVTRPMNSFMLYRAAYAERTKMWCLQNNHQVVSSVSGESWPLEPPEIREQYNEYARIEIINHQNAHPTYKFSPSKTAATSKKRKEDFSEEDDDDEPSDFDDPDGEWGPRSHRRSTTRRSRTISRDAGLPTQATNTAVAPAYSPLMPVPNRSSWDMNSESKMPPVTLGDTGIYNQFYQTPLHPATNLLAHGLEEVRMQKMMMATPFSSGQPLLGLPGGQHFELLNMNSQGNTPLPQDEQVDPMLLAYEEHVPHGLPGDLSRTPHFSGAFQTEPDQDCLQAYAEYPTEAWQGDPSIPSMEQGPEFDKWMDDHH